MIFDDTRCALGEGPLWHPLRQSLFWFDIVNKRMFERSETMNVARVWQFQEHVSAAGWIDQESLLIASETALFKFDLRSNQREDIVALEDGNKVTRSNDGRADAWGGFWIGTMGKAAEPQAGAIYRFYNGELVQLFNNITISNSICFSPDGKIAYFTDTPNKQIMKTRLDDDGWPIATPEIIADVTPHNPDGSVVDANGNLWNAQWGAGRVACYSPDGELIGEQKFDAAQISCPAFGGEDLQTLFATSAAIDLPETNNQNAGKTFATKTKMRGQAEHQVKLG